MVLRKQYKYSLLQRLSAKEFFLVRPPVISARRFSRTALVSERHSKKNQYKAMSEVDQFCKAPHNDMIPAPAKVKITKAVRRARKIAEREGAKTAAKAALAAYLKIKGTTEKTASTTGDPELDAKEMENIAAMMMSHIKPAAAKADGPQVENMKMIRAAANQEEFWRAMLTLVDDHDPEDVKYDIYICTLEPMLRWDDGRGERLEMVIDDKYFTSSSENEPFGCRKFAQLSWLVKEVVQIHFEEWSYITYDDLCPRAVARLFSERGS